MRRPLDIGPCFSYIAHEDWRRGSPMPYRPRAERERERLRAATDAASGTAMDRALAQIGLAFDRTASLNEFKMRVERTLRREPHHAAIRARYGARAAMLNGRGLGA